MHGRGATPPRAADGGGGRRARAKADKQARILAAARELLAEQGYAAMAMSEVARRADVAAGTVFQYAATKPELLMMVVAAQWSGYLSEQLAATPPAGLGTRDGAGQGAGNEAAASGAEAVRALIEPILAASRTWPEPTTWVAREILFGTGGPHRREVLALVDALTEAIAQRLGPGARTERARVAARLMVSGALVELHRTQEGRAEEATLTARVDEIVSITARGACSPDTDG